MKATGVVTSPNHPADYPNNLDKIETIEVESGKILRLEFTSFAVWVCDNCACDYVKVTDGDGKILMDKSCGDSSTSPSSSDYFQPPVIVTNTNTVEISFHTDGSNTKPGWSLSWVAVTPGLKALLATSTLSFLFDPSSLLSSLLSFSFGWSGVTGPHHSVSKLTCLEGGF